MALNAAVAVLVGGLALLVYIRTLAPGLMPILDTPGFQFVGRVLGTMHNPGYPAYVLITHLWSYLPVGSLAYRINLFSAVTGALAVAGIYVLTRLLGVRPVPASSAALALAFGSIFWSQAVIAEVYTLNAALIAWMLTALVAWRQTGRRWLFVSSVVLLALGVGNHTTIVLFAPGMAVYVMASDRRFALQPSTVGLTVVTLLLGLAQYFFIIIRTRTPGAYLESRASNLADLLGVMRGAQFEHALFSFSLREVLTDRPALILGRFVGPELTYPVLLLAAGGLILLVRRSWREGVLIVSGGLAVLLFVLNYDAGDIHVFTIPVLLVLWTGAAYALQAVATALQGRRALVVAFSAGVAAFPVWQLARNLAERDLSRDTGPGRQIDGLFAALPDGAFLVRENFVLDRMIMYKLLGEGAGARAIQAHFVRSTDAAAMHTSGRRIFAFPDTAHRFRYEGVNVRFAPLPVYAWTISDRLSELPAGWGVALALPTKHGAAFSRVIGDGLADIAPNALDSGRDQVALALVGTKGAAVTTRSRTSARAEVTVERNGISAAAGAHWAAIGVNGREIVRSEDGALLAILTPEGALESLSVLAPERLFAVAPRPGAYSVYEVAQQMRRRGISVAGTPAEGRTGLMLFQVPAGAEVIVREPDDPACDLRVVEQSGPGHARNDGNRLVVSASGGSGTFGALLATGCTADVTAQSTAAGATAFAVDTAGLLDLPSRVRETLLMARTEQAWLLGSGWSAVDADDAGPYRWMEGRDSTLLLPIARAGARRLRLQALVREHTDDAEMRLRLDDTELGPVPVLNGWHWYEWTLPPGPGDPGLHRLTISLAARGKTSGAMTTRLAVAQIELLGALEF